MKTRHKLITGISCASLLLAVSTTSLAEEWEHRIGTYILGMTIDADTAVNTPGGTQETKLKLDFDDILDNAEFIGVLFYHGTNGEWTVDVDLTHIELNNNDSFETPIPPPIGPVDATVDVDLTIDEYEFLLGRRFYEGDNDRAQVIFGMRYFRHDIDVEVEVGPGGFAPDIDSDWIDAVIGLRYQADINDQWSWLARGDVGGFGWSDSSDSSYKLELGAMYRINERWTTAFGYRYLYIDYEDGSPEDSDYYAFDGDEQGVLIGITYKI